MWRRVAQQLSNPNGMAGKVVGMLMTRANRLPTQLAIDALGILPGQDVLDLGCGPGQAIAQMLPLAFPGRVSGIDQSPTMIGQAQRANRAAISSGRARLDLGAFEKLPYPDACFDRILASNVAYFWHDAAAVLEEVRRVLKPGGRLAIYVTDAETMRGWKIAGAGTHRLFSPEDLRNILVRAGFAPTGVVVDSVKLPAGVVGIVATATADSIEDGIRCAA